MADFVKIARNAPTRIVPSEKEPNGKFSLKGGENKMTDFEQTSDGRTVAISLNLKKGVKTNILLGSLIENFGLENDANAGGPNIVVYLSAF